MTALTVGLSTPRISSMAKARAEERYASDINVPDMVWAVACRSGIPSGVLHGLDMDEALSLPGVLTVLTASDVKGTNLLGLIEPDQPVLVSDRIRYVGDPLCLVLASSQETAQKAVSMIKADIEELPAIFDFERALSPDSPVLYPDRPEGNLLIRGWVKRGDAEKAFKGCSHVVEGSFHFPMQEHGYLETESGVASYDGDVLTMEVSTQNPWRDRDELCRSLGVPIDKIRVIAPSLGGGFGGKDGVVIQGLLGLAALNSGGKTVKMVFSREESFACSPKRHRSVTTMKIGCDSSGVLKAIRCRLLMDSGAYAAMSVPVLMNSLDHFCGPYRFPSVDVEGKSVYTNNPFGGAFRAFGAPQVEGVLEQLIDQLACEVGLDPLQFRLKNVLRLGDLNGSGVTMTGVPGIAPCLERVKGHELWLSRNEWRSSVPEGKLRSTGIAATVHGQGFGPGIPDFANARIEIISGGLFRIYSGISDMGQGNSSTYVQLAGDLLSQGSERFEMVQPDTDRSLRSGPAAASRTTYMYGKALLDAAKDLKEKMLTKAAMVLGASRSDVVLIPGMVRALSSGRELSLEKLVCFMEPPERCTVAGFLSPVAEPDPGTDYGPKNMGFPHCLLSWSAHLARIEVDSLTGEVSVESYLAVTEAGRVLNPMCYHQQIEGGVAQGLGYALMEDFRVRSGKVVTKDFSTYLMPTIMDVPRIESIAVEIDEPSGPRGLKGLGELPLIGPLPAIGNALADLLGKPLDRSPYTAERVLKAIIKKGGGPF